MKVKIVTANRTLSGSVVYLTPSGEWTPTLTEAFWSSDEAALEARLSEARTQQDLVCDPYLLRVDQDEAGLRARTKREEIRAEGPTAMLETLGYGQSFLKAAQGDHGESHVSV
jgi:hypothetical protein